MPVPHQWTSFALATLFFALACGGGGGGHAGTEGATDTDTDTGPHADSGNAPATEVGAMGMRRLSRNEYDAAVRDLLADDTDPSSILPEDLFTPFDNDFTKQYPSQALVDAAEILATEIGERLVADPDRVALVVGCQPASASDSECMSSFVATFGRRALRRPLEPHEIDDFVALGLDIAGQAGDFNAGVEAIVQAFLQDYEFLYRVERGSPTIDDPLVFRLSGFEVATRLSFLIWGTTPDDWLLDQAQDGELLDDESRRAIASQMLADPRARGHADRFHSLWLGFHQLPHDPTLTVAMREETVALLERVLFDDAGSWLDLFTASETYLDDALADHYGLPRPAGGAGWVPYTDSGRQGLLSHGSVLSVAANVADTSPTKRGRFIRERLMCNPVPAPPDDVDADAPPPASGGECKEDQYIAHRNEPSCASCHVLMDPIGFGLENYDLAGRYRTHDDGNPNCTISGEGELEGIGTFRGPKALADLLVDNELIDRCVVDHLVVYAMGRAIEDPEVANVDTVYENFRDGGYRWEVLVSELVGHPSFGFRRDE